MKRLFASIAVFSLFCIGCGSKAPPQAANPAMPKAANGAAKPLEKPPEATSESEEGFHDLVFFVQEHKKLDDGAHLVRAAALHKGKPIALEVVVSAAWKSSAADKNVPIEIHQGKVVLRPAGPESDAFVQALDEIYGTKQAPKAMAKEVALNALSLEGNPSALEKNAVKIKVFYESGKEDDYAEFFINIDLAAKRLYINEKDDAYRAAIVKALGAK